MRRSVLVAYVLLIGWSIGAFIWIGKEMVEQRRLFRAVSEIKKMDSPSAETALRAVREDSPLYLVQELQQEPDRDPKVRVASVIEKAIGRNPRPPDPGHVLAFLANEKRTLDQMIEGRISDVDTSWLTPEFRERLRNFRSTAQLVLLPEQQGRILEKVSAVSATMWQDLPPRLRQQLLEDLVDFVKTRWADLTTERADRLAGRIGELIRFKYGRSSREERERLVQHAAVMITSRSQDLSPENRKWLADHLSEFVAQQLPESTDPGIAQEVRRITQDYALYGWAPLVVEEARLFEQSQRLRRLYNEQRERLSRALIGCIEEMTRGGGDIDRVLLTELVSLLGDPCPEVAENIRKTILVIARHRLSLLATACQGKDEAAWFRTTSRVRDMITLVRKTLYRENVPSVMIVPTRQKTKEERSKDLSRLLHAARLRCAEVLGNVAMEALRAGGAVPDPDSAKRFAELTVDQCDRALRGILGSPDAEVVDAAHRALRALDASRSTASTL